MPCPLSLPAAVTRVTVPPASTLCVPGQLGAITTMCQALRETVASATSPAGSGLAVPTDVTVPESVAGLFETVHQRWGRVDLLVNNAGVFGPAGAVDEISWTGWQHAVDTN